MAGSFTEYRVDICGTSVVYVPPIGENPQIQKIYENDNKPENFSTWNSLKNLHNFCSYFSIQKGWESSANFRRGILTENSSANILNN